MGNEERRPRILIIDDMAINRMLLSSQLGALQVEADVSASGQKGIELCEQIPYDLILIDRHMPDLDGIETLEKLNQLFREKGREVPVICETADGSEEARKELLDAGFAEILVKPVDFGELHDMLERRLGDKYFGAKADATVSEEEIEAAYEELPAWLKEVPGIDVRSGIKRCGGSAEAYLDALAIFAVSIDEKAKDVRHYLEVNNDRINVLRIHSLKSSARLVGAVTLAEQAAALEMAGKVGNHASLESGVEGLIAHYQELEEQLKENLTGRAAGEGASLPPISQETIEETYAAILDAAEASEKENIERLLAGLGEYALSSEDAVCVEKLKIAARKEDYAAMKGIMERN